MKQQTSATIETFIKGRTVTDFGGKTIYVGIDVHQKDYQVAKVLDGICLGNHRMCADSDQLIEHLQSRYPEQPLSVSMKAADGVLTYNASWNRQVWNV